MIKKVEIENFQSHKKTILEFVPDKRNHRRIGRWKIRYI